MQSAGFDLEDDLDHRLDVFFFSISRAGRSAFHRQDPSLGRRARRGDTCGGNHAFCVGP